MWGRNSFIKRDGEQRKQKSSVFSIVSRSIRSQGTGNRRQPNEFARYVCMAWLSFGNEIQLQLNHMLWSSCTAKWSSIQRFTLAAKMSGASLKSKFRVWCEFDEMFWIISNQIHCKLHFYVIIMWPCCDCDQPSKYHHCACRWFGETRARLLEILPRETEKRKTKISDNFLTQFHSLMKQITIIKSSEKIKVCWKNINSWVRAPFFSSV